MFITWFPGERADQQQQDDLRSGVLTKLIKISHRYEELGCERAFPAPVSLAAEDAVYIGDACELDDHAPQATKIIAANLERDFLDLLRVSSKYVRTNTTHEISCMRHHIWILPKPLNMVAKPREVFEK